jgi:hypothetical protein
MAKGKLIGKGGVNLTVEADPEKLLPPSSSSTPSGRVVLHLSNTNPAQMFVDPNKVLSCNNAIAIVNMAPVFQVPLPKRASPWTSKPTPAKPVQVGNWSVSAHASRGDYTQLIVECDIRDDLGMRVDCGDPSVDVEVN